MIKKFLIKILKVIIFIITEKILKNNFYLESQDIKNLNLIFN